MAQNENLVNLDAGQAFKRTMDGEHDAVRVVNAVNTQVAIEISAEEGDSVQTVARTRCMTDGEFNCSDLRRVCKYGEGSIEVSPNGTDFIELSCDVLEVKEICAMKIRISGCMVVGQS